MRRLAICPFLMSLALLSASPLHLALGQAGFFGAGFVFWYWEHRRERAAQAACTGH